MLRVGRNDAAASARERETARPSATVAEGRWEGSDESSLNDMHLTATGGSIMVDLIIAILQLAARLGTRRRRRALRPAVPLDPTSSSAKHQPSEKSLQRQSRFGRHEGMNIEMSIRALKDQTLFGWMEGPVSNGNVVLALR